MNAKRKAFTVLTVFLLSAMMASATNITTALSSISGNYSIVWFYNASVSNSALRWSSYMPDYPSLAGFTDMFVNYGYWVNINSSNETLQVTGTVPSSTTTALVEGWNLVGYPSLTSQNITVALATISGNYSIIWMYNASVSNSALRWSSYMPDYPSLAGFDYMNAGNGYWVRINVSSESLVI